MTFGWGLRLAVLALAAGLSACGGGGVRPPEPGRPAAVMPGGVTLEEFDVAAKDEGVKLYLRNKHPAEYFQPRPERTVLFLHGATFPGSASFDLSLDGGSWMDDLAKRGYDVYALDLRGYGKSTRPAEMDQPAEANPPLAGGATALADVSKAVDFILSRRSLDRLVLVGWSWGASLAGAYANEAGQRVEKLVLYSPQWPREDAAPAEALAKLGAWREVPLAQVKERWIRDVPAKEREDLVSKATMNAWTAALGGGAVLKVPNGAVADTLRSWAEKKPLWQPGRVSVPTLVVQGEWDVENPPEMGLSVFANLTGAPVRRYVLVGEGTHTLLLEKNRHQLYRAVRAFLEEER